MFRNNERPFHPERLSRIFKDFGTSLVKNISGKGTEGNASLFASVVRCKGELWLSNADSCPIDVHSVGVQLVMTPAGNGMPWIGKVLEVHPSGDPESSNSNEEDLEVWETLDVANAVAELKANNDWTDRFGDRRSELVFIGIKLNQKLLLMELNNALLTDAELNVAEEDRKKVWSQMKDPFFDGAPLWDLEDVLGVDEGDERES